MNAFASYAHEPILAGFLLSKKSPTTKRTYQSALNHFCRTVTGDDACDSNIELFLSLAQEEALSVIDKYRTQMIQDGRKAATIAVRMIAIKELVKYAIDKRKCSIDLSSIKESTVPRYKDTSGLKVEEFIQLISQVDTSKILGIRDYAILRLLWDNALRNAELRNLSHPHFNAEQKSLYVNGKNNGNDLTRVQLNNHVVDSIQLWLTAKMSLQWKSVHQYSDRPLFCSLDRATMGHRLSGTSVYKIVNFYAQKAGINKAVSPSRLRHSAITAALDMTNGNVRKVQSLSRHKDLNTLMIYDDNRNSYQGEVTSLLGDAIT